MKKFYFLFLIFVVQISFAQDFFYKKDASSIPIVGEESLVIFEKPPVNKYEELNAEKSIGPGFLRFFDTNLNTFVNLSYKIIKNQSNTIFIQTPPAHQNSPSVITRVIR